MTIRTIRVYPMPGQRARGWLVAGALRLPCALGRSGVTRQKREGDGATPAGHLALRRIWWRADRGPPPRTLLPLRRIKPSDGWCDAPGHARYNRAVSLPFAASHEEMWRADGLYDCVVELGWNDRPAMRGRGSAIFLHVARPGFMPTAGCIALQPGVIRRVLALMSPRTRILVL